jgi:uncharacterized membrane protein
MNAHANGKPRGIPIEEAIRFGWETFKGNFELILAIEIAAAVALAVVGGASDLLESRGWFHEFAMSLAYFVVTMIIHLGAIKVSLKYRDGDKVDFANMFDSFGILAPYMAAAVVTQIAIGFGLLFLVVPGIVVAVRFCLFGFAVVDEDRGPIDAIRRSIQLTDGVGVDLFLFGMLCVGLNVLGTMALLVGLFVSLPVTALAGAHIYRHLNPRAAVARAEANDPLPERYP